MAAVEFGDVLARADGGAGVLVSVVWTRAALETAAQAWRKQWRRGELRAAREACRDGARA